MNRTLLISSTICLLAFSSHELKEAKASSVNPGKSTSASSAAGNAEEMNKYLGELMSKMTLEEKIGQLNLPSVGFDVTGPVISEGVDEKIRKGLVGGVFNSYTPVAIRKLQKMAVEETRLKIPLIFGYDVIHGHKTTFPINLGLAASWNMDLIERCARAAAEEASADGLNWTFSPMLDIARDPRWGRVSEGAGEDPYLGSLIAQAMVRGYQGPDFSKPDRIMACVKHFALYGAAEAGRDYNTVDMSKQRMYNEYLPPYKAAVDAGAASVMSSFNEIDGVPASGNKWLITDLLRKQWGFKGFVVTDYTAINEMISHGMGDDRKVGELSLNAGIDMDMVGEIFLKYGAELVKSGRVAESQVDAACRRVLEAKYKLGLFKDPYRFVSDEHFQDKIMSPEKLALAKEAAAKSIVLLKNDKQTLPLSPDKKIAFIGPLVKDQRNLLGSWCAAGNEKKCVSIWQALESKFGKDKFSYALGCNLIDDPVLVKKLTSDGVKLEFDKRPAKELREEAVKVASQADVLVLALGENSDMSGEAASRSQIGLPDSQGELLSALKATGKPIVLVLMNGRPLTLSWEDQNMDAILETWYGGTMAGAAIVDTVFGDNNPRGKLSMSFPRNVGQIPVFYNHKNTGRPFDPKDKYRSKYMDVPNEPLYPFGHGLSYTSFAFGDVKLSSDNLKSGEKISASITIANTGKRDAVETVQLYIRDMVGSITRPVLELKKFQQVNLKAGESKTVSFDISEEDLKFYNADLKYAAEPGDFKLFIGPNSKDLKESKFKLN